MHEPLNKIANAGHDECFTRVWEHEEDSSD